MNILEFFWSLQRILVKTNFPRLNYFYFWQYHGHMATIRECLKWLLEKGVRCTKKVDYEWFFFFFGFPSYSLKNFNQRLITVHNGWANCGINRWPMEFFQSAVAWTWTRELLVKLKTTTLRSSALSLGQPHSVEWFFLTLQSISSFKFLILTLL